MDTICSIYLNDHLVGTTENMFRHYYFNMTSAMNRGTNLLKAVFGSPVMYASGKAKEFQSKFGYSVNPNCPPAIANGVCHANFIRKMQASFSWDWGPAFPTMGFYREVWIRNSSCFLDSVAGVPVLRSKTWVLNTELFVYCHRPVSGKVSFTLPELDVSEKLDFSLEDIKPGLNRLFKPIEIPSTIDLSLWWPNGYGAQKMYSLEAALRLFESQEVLKIATKVGFRTVELIENPVRTKHGPSGLTFFFKVNSVPIFLKGTNWIPADSFQPRISSEKLKFLFQSMSVANMNAMRVWGGGVYESEEFYDLADRHGLLIWQDMMFACASYPGDPVFLQR